MDGQHFWGSLLGQKQDNYMGLKLSLYYYNKMYFHHYTLNSKMCLIKNAKNIDGNSIFSMLIILVKCNKNKKCIVWRELLLSVIYLQIPFKFTFSGYCLFNWLLFFYILYHWCLLISFFLWTVLIFYNVSSDVRCWVMTHFFGLIFYYFFYYLMFFLFI